jgi:N-acetylgalactosamine-N,N'-diacetylbacillosaminyl-diphospho-undecaprenol 4-alpha-N-acetylgalactosaminyltransferase
MVARTSVPRVLFVINSLAGGGAERVMLALLAASRDMLGAFDFSLALLDDEPRSYTPPDWLRIHQLDSRFKLGRSLSGLRALAAVEKPDLTLSFLTRSNLSTVALAKLRGHKAVISERANTSGHFKPGAGGKVAKAMIRIAYPRADHVVAVSQGIADDLIGNFGCDAKRVSTIANPVDAARICALGTEPSPLPVSGPYAVAVSRLTKSKNVGMLVEALAASDTGLSLVILGQGAEREAILARVAELGLQDRVIMPGFLSNPYPVVRGAACYLSASNGEGFPNGLVEALALGVPAVATNCPSGPSEILAEKRREDVPGPLAGPFGMLVPQNDVAAMADAIRTIVAPERAAAFALAGPKRAADFSVESSRDQYWNVIRTLL